LNCQALRAEEFFPVRDENPLTRGFYLPLPSDARRDDLRTLTATLTLSNTVNVEQRGPEELLVDGESDTLRLSFDAALRGGWRYRLTVPVVRDSGGFLDGLIESWHQFFGLPRGDRVYYPKNQLDYFYLRSGGRNISVLLDHPQTSVGDLSADAGWYAADDAARTVSFWAGVKAPTGSAARLTGDGAWDAAAWAHWAQRFARWQLAAEAGVLQPFGDEIFAGEAHRSAAFARFAATRSLDEAWSLRAQLDGQSRRVDGDLRFLGQSLQLTLGATRRLRGRWRLEMGFSEDAAVNTAPDVGFFIAVHD
jgi:hypothetical protein